MADEKSPFDKFSNGCYNWWQETGQYVWCQNRGWIKNLIIFWVAGFLFVQCIQAMENGYSNTEVSAEKYAAINAQVAEDPSIKPLVAVKLKDGKLTMKDIDDLKKEIDNQRKNNLKKSILK